MSEAEQNGSKGGDDAAAGSDSIRIVAFDGSDQTAGKLIESTLSERQIAYSVEGSVVYTVSVARRDARRALEAIKNCSALQGRWYKILEGELPQE